MICWFPVIVQPVPIVFSPNLLVDYFFCFSFCALPVIYFFKKLSDCVYWGKRNQLTLIIIKPLRLMLSIPIVNSLLTNVILIVNRYWQMSSLLSIATDKCHPYCQSLVTKLQDLTYHGFGSYFYSFHIFQSRIMRFYFALLYEMKQK